MTNWTKPAYPGDAVRMQMLRRGDEIGDVRIQAYNEVSFCIATFLPGNTVCFPGDTAKVEPEHSEWTGVREKAVAIFETMLATARADGWEDYTPCRAS